MATINTADDLIEVLRNDGRVRSAVRRELLTDELIAMPEKVDKLVGSMTAMQESQIAMQESLTAMQNSQAEMQKNIESLTEGQAAATEHRSKLHTLHRQEHDALHRFRGNYAVDAARRSRFEIAEAFAQLDSVERINVDVLEEAELRTMRDKSLGALNSMKVGNKALNAFPAIDLALRVTEMEKSSGLEFYVVVEASYTGTSDDIERAAVRAQILGAITGRKAYAVVAAAKPNRGLEGRVVMDPGEYVASDDGSGAFWYQIDDKELQPESPR